MFYLSLSCKSFTVQLTIYNYHNIKLVIIRNTLIILSFFNHYIHTEYRTYTYNSHIRSIIQILGIHLYIIIIIYILHYLYYL